MPAKLKSKSSQFSPKLGWIGCGIYQAKSKQLQGFFISHNSFFLSSSKLDQILAICYIYIQCGTLMMSWVNPYPFIESIHTLDKRVWIDSNLRVWIDSNLKVWIDFKTSLTVHTVHTSIIDYFSIIIFYYYFSFLSNFAPFSFIF